MGQALSNLGTEVGTLAYPLLVLALTHSPLTAGAVGTVASLARFVVRLPAGSLADRLDRRRAMVVCDGVRAVALLGLTVLVVAHEVSWPVVMLVAVVDRAGDALFEPASMAALPALVADHQLEPAWASTEARMYGAGLVGPALGGLLYGVGRAVPFASDALSYAASVATSGAMRGRFTPGERDSDSRSGLWAEAVDGLRHLWRDQLLRAVAIQGPLINFAFNGVIYAVILCLRQHDVSAGVVGLTQAAIAGGGLLGALVAPGLQGRASLHQMVLVLTVGGVALLLVAGALAPSPLLALPIAATLFLAPTCNAKLIAAMMRATPEQLRGRVNNSVLLTTGALAVFSPLVAGLVVAHLSPHVAIGGFGLVLVVSAVLALALPGLRQAEAALASSPADGR